MISLNLEANGAEQTVIKDYLESNVSEALAEKINNGVPLEKDGKTLINKKDLTTFLNYAYEEARKQAEKGARCACVKSDTVFNWAIHYFQEDSLEGTLYNEDGTEYKPPRPAVTKKPVTPAPKPKPQLSLFDMMAKQAKTPEPEAKQPIEEPETRQEVETRAFIDEPQINEYEEPPIEEPEEPQESKLIQISENEYVDENGEIFTVAQEQDDACLNRLIELFGKQNIIAR